MTAIHGTEASHGRLGAVLRSRGVTGPVLLGRFGPWLATSAADVRTVLTTPETFDFVSDVSREPIAPSDGETGPRRSRHSITPPVTAEQASAGREIFVEEWRAATDRIADGDAVDTMQLLRAPVARSTTGALMPELAIDERNRVGDLVLAWIDALAPVISSAWGPWRWSPARRREVRARARLNAALAGVGAEDPSALATVLAAGIQVPIAAGSWLLAELAHLPEVHAEVRQDPRLVAGVVWETLRLCSPTWITARVAREDTLLGSGRIESGSIVLVSPLLLGRDESLVPGPPHGQAGLDEFAPGRWMQDDVRPGAWLPFGAGPHTCPGRNLGLAQLTCLAEWSLHWTMTPGKKMKVDQSRGIFPKPAVLRLRRTVQNADL